MIIHLNGWPGSGKLTVARELARKLEARLLDNHTLHDVPGRLCDRGTPEYWELYYQVRDVAYRRVLALPSHETVVMTNALTNESDREREAWSAVKELAVARAAPLMAITLDCSLDENVRRIASDGRRHRKLTDAVPLIEWRSTLTLLTDDSARSITIDNTNLSPDQAADAILAFVRPSGLPASGRAVIKHVAVRQAVARDAQAIHELHLSSVRALCAPWYESSVIAGWLQDRSPAGYLRGIAAGATFVAEVESRVVGFGEAVPGEVVAVFVDPEWSRRGVGAALMARALDVASPTPRVVRLESTLNAVAFYERLGFTSTSRATVRRNEVDVPVVIMELLNPERIDLI